MVTALPRAEAPPTTAMPVVPAPQPQPAAPGRDRFVTAAVVVTLLLFGRAVLVPALQILTTGRPRISTTIAVEASGAGVTAALSNLLLVAATGLTLLTLLANAGRLSWNPRLPLLLAPWTAITLAGLLNTGRPSVSTLLVPAVGLLATQVRDLRPVLRVIGGLTVVTAAMSLAAAAVVPSLAITQAGLNDAKAVIGGQLLAGLTLHPNTLALQLALGLPFVALIRRAPLRRVGLAMVLFALVWTSSRTSLVAVAVGLAALALFQWGRSTRTGWGLAPLGLLGVYAVAVLTGPYLALTTRAADAFTGRGAIWAASLDYWQLHPWIGNGPTVYNRVARIANDFGAGAFHGHSTFVNVLTISGVVGMAAVTAVVLWALRTSYRAGWAGRWHLAMWPLVFVTMGWFEVPTDFSNIGTSAWVVIIPLAAVVLADPEAERRTPPAGVRPAS